MHIIIGLLGGIVSILWLLHRLARMGIDLGGLNPFLWRRRRNWAVRYNANPIFRLESPMEATALLVTATAKVDGDMTLEEKTQILQVFAQEFHLSEKEASSLLVSSAHLLGTGDEVRDNMQGVLEASLPNFSPEQTKSALSLIQGIAQVGGTVSQAQRELIQNAEQVLDKKPQAGGKWQ